MGLGSTGLDAQPHAGAISCQIEPQEMGTDAHCTVRLRTWGRNISPRRRQLSSIDKNKTAQWRQERVLKTAGAQRRKPQGTKPIEEPRWELLKHWYSSSEVITNWNEQWVKTDEWEKKGGSTLHWSITSWLREHFKLGSIAVTQSRTVDPSV